ncbi:hypothetical protein PoB_003356400 [Plakobranchus ocellatus]|uniref:Uncharacterized protein n=1 Tax=Plakobranchus ocellatus TaxID=259542 RepID=A0AAV4AL10_9GAST|nr:hypothetical protein PoB_003356400 [Plakobranchus ocellatus]
MDALDDYKVTSRIAGTEVTKLFAGEGEALANLVKRRDQNLQSMWNENPRRKKNMMTNNTNCISTDIQAKEQPLLIASTFKCDRSIISGESSKSEVQARTAQTTQGNHYQQSIISDESSKSEVQARIAQTTAELIRLRSRWNDNNFLLSSKFRLMRSLVKHIFLYACETWTLTAELQRIIQAREMRSLRKILYHVSNEDISSRANH